MKTRSFSIFGIKSVDHPLQCLAIFLFLFKGCFVALLFIRYDSWPGFLYLFFLGWLCWTFFEYMLHRFLWHHKNEHKRMLDNVTHHAYHHTHPSEIKMNNTRRLLFLSGTSVFVAIAVWLNNYFTMAAGFAWGFTFYSFMHLFLHTRVTQKIFPRLVRYHMYHHCKYPDKCFGITVTWWDDLFRSVPADSKIISTKVIDFYFGEKDRQPITTATKVVLCAMLVISTSATCMAQNKSLIYDVVRNGSKIGSVTISEAVNANLSFYELTADVKTKLVFSFSSYINEQAVFEDGIMTNSFYYQKQNGHETRKNAVMNQSYYRLVNDNDTSMKTYFPVTCNYIQVFFDQPESSYTQVYSNAYQQMLTMKKKAANRYSIEFPNGDTNYYNYSNGVCINVDIARTLFTVHFVLRKITP